MKANDRYLKIVEWSEEDKCYLGTCPGLMLGGIHGDDEMKVYRELREAVDEWIAIHQDDETLFRRRRRERNTPENSSCGSARNCISSLPSPLCVGAAA